MTGPRAGSRRAGNWRGALAAWLAVLGSTALACGTAQAQTVPPQAQAAAQTQAASRQILVMLRLPAQHFRPGANYGSYYDDKADAQSRRAFAARIAQRNGLSLVGDGWPMPSLGIDCYTMQVPASESLDSAIARVSADRNVAWSQPMHVYEARSRAEGNASGHGLGDPLFAAQPAATAWHLASLHQMATGKGAIIAVIDSKVDIHHPDLEGQVAIDRDFLPDRSHAPEVHGTGVAAVIAARENNGVGIAGIAPDSRLMALRACWQTGPALTAPTLCDSLSLARALDFAIAHDATIINMSLSGPDDRLLAQLIAMAQKRQIAVVAAYDPALPRGGFPAMLTGVIAVTDNCALASAMQTLYCAPGEGIPTARPGGTWFLANGSSFAAAHVSGLIALLRERHASAAHPVLVSFRPNGGQLDACATLRAVSRLRGCTSAEQ
jgi:hypothetical protein